MLSKITSCIVIFALLLLWFPPISNAQQSTYTIAVLDLDANGVSLEEARSLSNELRTYITQLVQSREFMRKSDASYTVLERSQMDKILDQFNIQNSGCTDISCAVEFGKMLNVEGIIIGSVGLVGQTYTLNISMVDIKSSITLKSASYKSKGERDNLLNEGIPATSRSLLGLGKKFPWKKTLLVTGTVVGGIVIYALLKPSPEEPGEITIAIPVPQE
jgi:hypothetical protein